MNRWIFKASVLFLAGNLALACGDDEDDGNTGTGGSAGEGGSGGGSAGEGEGGTPEPGSGGGGGSPEPVTCSAPTPPDVGGGEGGAGGSGALGGAGGAEAVGGGDAVGGNGAGGTGPVSEGLTIVGSYTDDYEGEHAITNATWTTRDSVYNISQFDNEAGYVIARNDEGNEFSPCAWSRFDWTESEGDLYFCQTAFAAESEEAALETEPADPEDLEEGCSGFPWSKLTPQ
jgi:hypothetical protein